jgi:hypothetical protein
MEFCEYKLTFVLAQGEKYGHPWHIPKADINRTDKKQHFSEKVTKVESILAEDAE